MTSILCAIAILVPLTWTNLSTAVYTLPRFWMLAVLVAIGCARLCWEVRRGRPLWAGKADPALLALVLVYVITTLFSQDIRDSVDGNYNWYAYGLGSAGLYAACYCLAAWRLPDVRRERVMAAVLIGAVLVAMMALIQWLGLDPLLHIQGDFSGRAFAVIGQPVHLGMYLALIWPLGIWAVFRGLGPPKSRSWLLLGALSGLIIGVAIILTASRAAAGGAVVGALAYLWLTGRLRANRTAVLALGLFVAAAALVTIRIRGDNLPKSDNIRLEAWRVAGKTFTEHPILGVGPATLTIDYRREKGGGMVEWTQARLAHSTAHNDLLEFAAAMGLPGLLAYLWLIWAIWRFRHRGDSAAACISGLAGLFAAAKLNPLALPTICLAAMLAGLSAAPGERRRCPAWAPVMLALSLLALTRISRLFAADAHIELSQRAFRSGRPWRGFGLAERGVSLNPCEPRYQMYYVNRIADLFQDSSRARDWELTPEAVAELEKRVVLAGLRAVRCRPQKANSHYLLGFAAYIRSHRDPRWKPTARLATARALALAPGFGPLQRLGRAVGVGQCAGRRCGAAPTPGPSRRKP